MKKSRAVCKGGTNPPACSPGLCAWPSRCCYPLTITENSVTRSLANNIRFGLHVIARSEATKQSIAGSSSTPSNGRSIAAPVTPWATNAHGSRNEPCGMNCSLSCRTRCGTSFPRPRHADGNRHQLFMSEKKSAPAQPAPHAIKTVRLYRKKE